MLYTFVDFEHFTGVVIRLWVKVGGELFVLANVELQRQRLSANLSNVLMKNAH